MKDDFATSISGPNLDQRDLPSAYPKNAESSDVGTSAKPKFNAKYAKFILDDDGAPELEQIMDDCMTGKYILCEEKWHFTKEGDAIVIVKYLIPVIDKPVPLIPWTTTDDKNNTLSFPGRRRQRKSLEKKEQ